MRYPRAIAGFGRAVVLVAPLPMRVIRPLIVAVFASTVVACGGTRAQRPPTTERAAAPSPVVAPPATTKPPAPLSAEDIAKRALKATVLVETPTKLGTGFVIAGGLVVTSLHVVAGAQQVTVKLPSGQVLVVQSIRGVDRRADLALLDANLKMPGLPLAPDETNVSAGAPVVIVGNPEGLQGTVSTGVISRKRKAGPGLELLQVDAAISHGSSGGPVLDRDGHVIGVVELYLSGGQNLNFAVPIAYVQKLLKASDYPISMATFASMTAPPPVKKKPAAQASASASSGAAPTRPNFPASVAGFPFGITVAQASQLCAGQLAGTVKTAWCPLFPVGVLFAKPGSSVELDFDANQLNYVGFFVSSWRAAFEALSEKYGDPDFVTLKVKGRWIFFQHVNGQWFQKPIHDARARQQNAEWKLPGGAIMLAPSAKTKTTIAVGYISARGEELRKQNY